MSETERFVLSVTGSDRPGLTKALAEAIVSVAGNWQGGHLSRLGGLYVGSVLIEIAPERLDDLRDAISAIGDDSLAVVALPAGDREPHQGAALLFELVGQDRPGIIKEVTTILTDLGANIESLSSGEEMGAWGGEHLFRAKVEASLPDGVSPEEVQRALEDISSEIMVDFTFGSAGS